MREPLPMPHGDAGEPPPQVVAHFKQLIELVKLQAECRRLGVITMEDLHPDSTEDEVMRACDSFIAVLDIEEREGTLGEACEQAVRILRRVKLVLSPVGLVAELFSEWKAGKVLAA